MEEKIMNSIKKLLTPNRSHKSMLDTGPPTYFNQCQSTDVNYVYQTHQPSFCSPQAMAQPVHQLQSYVPTMPLHYPQQQQQTAHQHHHHHHHQQQQHQQQQTHQHHQHMQAIQPMSPTCATCQSNATMQSPQQAAPANYQVHTNGYQIRTEVLDTSARMLAEPQPVSASAVTLPMGSVQTIQQQQSFNSHATACQAVPTMPMMMPINGQNQNQQQQQQQQSSRYQDNSYYSNQPPIMTSPQVHPPQPQQQTPQRNQQPQVQQHQQSQPQQVHEQFQQMQLKNNGTSNGCTTNGYVTANSQQQPPSQQQHHHPHHQQQQQPYQNHDELANGDNEELPLEASCLMYERNYEDLHKAAKSLRADIRKLKDELCAIRNKTPQYEVTEVKI